MTRSMRFVALLLVAAVGGCRSGMQENSAESSGWIGPFGSLENPIDWSDEDDEPRSGTPRRVVATWVDSIRQQAGKPSERGFGGRLYFYDEEADPITVEGRLVVYAFDEDGRSPIDHKPTRRYVFPADQITRHMSVSEIGPSYSFWLPWGGVEGPPKEISLIARFEPTRGGGLVVSDQATQQLPGQGIAPPQAGGELLAEEDSASVVRQVGYAGLAQTAYAKKDLAPKARLSTTTIRLSR